MAGSSCIAYGSAAGSSPRPFALCLRSAPTRLARCSSPRPGEYDATTPDSKLGCQRRRPAVPSVAVCRVNGQAGHRDARRAELGRRAEAARAGEVASGPSCDAGLNAEAAEVAEGALEAGSAGARPPVGPSVARTSASARAISVCSERRGSCRCARSRNTRAKGAPADPALGVLCVLRVSSFFVLVVVSLAARWTTVTGMRRHLAIVLCLIALAVVGLSPQARPSDFDRGHVGLGLALRRLATATTFMMATAHPDDENNSLLAMVSRGLGVRTVLATATRGDGGQNEIGPELFDALAALRTEELLAAHRIDGAEQLFTRAVDFGYSFSIEETFERWGREEILGDYVRLIRMTRPDVILGLRPDGTGGGQHHQASARLAREAFRAAGDPAKFPDQIDRGAAPLAGGEVLLLRPVRVPRRSAPRSVQEVRHDRLRDLRPAARPHLRRDGQRSARDAQVSGLRPAPGTSHGAAPRPASN